MAFTFKRSILLALLAATVSGARAATDDPAAIKDADEVKTIESISEVTLTVSQVNETGVVTYTNTTGNKTISRQYHTRQDTLYDGERLLGGTAATDTTTSPYAVYVNALDSDATKIQRYCSGALISNTYVLTAASCVVDAYGIIKVYAGDKGGAMNEKSATAIIYPKYVRNAREHDIALLQLTTAYTLTTAINTILLPTAGTYLKSYNFLGETYRVYGYGAPLGKLGDVGAPVVAQATGSSSSAVLVAIVTDYFKCTDSSIVTRIAPYLPWIRNYVSTTINQG
ncbi:hypothetical protein B566_EDAN015650 [Ephemera danica]|nr:hypothetical protein B566_EDAN015650 [Ephemera danica]